MSFRPSALCAVAPTGQTCSQGAFSHCWQGTGWKNVGGLKSESSSLDGLFLAAFHDEVMLGASERKIVAGFLDGAAGGEGCPKGAGSTHGVSVESFVRSGVARFLAPVS